MSLLLEAPRLRYGAGAGARELSFPSLTLHDGEHLLLQGRSGSGKSSLLALLAGLRTPSAGRLLLDGIDPAALSPVQRDAWRGACLGFVPQRLHLSASLSVADNLAVAYVAVGLRPDLVRIRYLLAQLGVAELEERLPHELSQGQAQRVALARALLRRPRFVLADEPTANLDDQSCGAILTLLRESAQQHGLCLVIATHDARVRLALADWTGWRTLTLDPNPGEEGA